MPRLGWSLPGAAALVLLAGCVPSPGPFVLPPLEGRVVDTDTGAPIADAEVVARWVGGGVPGSARPEYHARWTRSDAAGRFRLEGGLAPSPRMWLLRTYGPELLFFHPGYGLVRSGVPEDPARVLLRGSRASAEARLRDLDPFCRGEVAGAGARHLAEVACGPRPSRPH